MWLILNKWLEALSLWLLEIHFSEYLSGQQHMARPEQVDRFF